ncbi:kinase-like domain-containing protein [Tribonema minus]|uniref:Kinase-like domain-containing protein n=1 Tax=Tribonema minus TaxID=303371 RepID=A0A835ZET3_9STRA|nr:kinase-like domain-containing protein [Tribonema minus]
MPLRSPRLCICHRRLGGTSIRELQKDCLLRNNASRGTYDRQPFAYGAFRSVAKGKYTKGPRAGDAMVVKWFTTGTVFEESYYDTDVLTVKTATGIINAFNALNLATQKVYLNQPEVWKDLNDDSKLLVEPYMADFRKFNSNTGGTSGDSLMTALSHYSYHHSGAKLLLCDLQGAARSDCYIITDPVVMSARREYGPTDLGQAGINNFFYHHRCSSLCQPHWQKNRGQYQYTPVMTTTLT